MKITSAYGKALEITNGKVTDMDTIRAAFRFIAAEKAEAEETLARAPLTSAIRASEMADKANALLCKYFDEITA